MTPGCLSVMSSDIVAPNSIWTQQSILTEEVLFLDRRLHSFLIYYYFFLMHVSLTTSCLQQAVWYHIQALSDTESRLE